MGEGKPSIVCYIKEIYEKKTGKKLSSNGKKILCWKSADKKQLQERRLNVFKKFD